MRRKQLAGPRDAIADIGLPMRYRPGRTIEEEALQMATLSVVYPRQAGANFDYDYYQNKHLPLATQRWANAGLTGGEALLGQASLEGSDAPFFAIGIIHFESADALHAALNGEHAAEVIGDIRNFTDVQPIIQVNERFVP